MREVLTGSGGAVVVRTCGDDLSVLREKAREVQEVLSQVDGLVEEHVDLAGWSAARWLRHGQ